MGKPITWQPKPLRQIKELFHYFRYQLGTEQAVDNFLEILGKKLDLISQFPKGGHPTGRANVRYVKIGKNQSLFYRIRLTKIQILLLWDSRQHPDKNPYLKKSS